MNDALKTLESILHGSTSGGSVFPPNSRYHGVAITVYRRPDGRMIAHLERRFVPEPARFATTSEHAVTEGERIDHLAASYFGDPELAWRLSDANGVLRPDELTETIGRRVRITLPEGIPGASRA